MGIKRKTTEEFIKEISHTPYKVLSEYKGNKIKIKLECPVHGPFLIYPHNILYGYGCKKCGTKRANEKVTKTHEWFLEKVEKDEYDIISRYKNAKTKIEVKCPRHGSFFALPANLMKGHRCQKCGLEKANKIHTKYDRTKVTCPKGHEYVVVLNKPDKKHKCPICFEKKVYSIEDAKKIFEDEGYTLLSTKYNKMVEKLSSVCEKGHTYKVSLYSFLIVGTRCLECQGIKTYTIEDVKKLFDDKGWILQTTFYKNFQQKLDVICPKGHRTKKTLNDFIGKDSGCLLCSSVNKHTIEKVREALEKEKYTLISTEYVGVHDKLKSICPNGHEYLLTFANFNNHGRRCPECIGHGTSRSEKNLIEWVKNYYSSAHKIRINREGKKFFEYDIYVPELKLAIEYCGLFWHSEAYKENNYHLNKLQLCNSKNIRLITIFEDEWLERQKQVKGFFLSVLNKNSRKLYARKLKLKEVSKEEAKTFLEETHIQSFTTFCISFGLYQDEELLAVITGNQHHRQGHGHLFVLNRLAFKYDVSIAGGSSRLLKALIQWARTNGYGKLISWSDNRWSEGNVYEKLGITHDRRAETGLLLCQETVKDIQAVLPEETPA